MLNERPEGKAYPNLTHGHAPFIGLPVSGIMLCVAVLYAIRHIGGYRKGQ